MRGPKLCTLSILMLVAHVASAAAPPPRTRATWPIPAVAWRVPIGGYDRGIPIGGIGAGSIMLNGNGSFGPWRFQPGQPEEQRRLAAAAFHVYEKVEGKPATVTTLTTTPHMPAWTPLPPNAGFYHALYPKGWFAYRCFTTDLSLKFFTPILRGNTRETSYPVAVFEFSAANPTDKPIEIAILFSFPNTHAHASELRTGFMNFVEARDNLAAVVLDARSDLNPPTTQDTEWCIAVKAEKGGEVSYVSSWNAMANGGDLMKAFAAGGKLPNAALDATESAAAVAFHATIAPGKSITAPFALSWDFPRVAFGKTQWWRRYTEPLGRTGNASSSLAREALAQHTKWEAAIDAWTKPILDEPAYPDWLKQAALNQLAIESGAFWEAGCITEPKEFKGLHPEDHKFFAVASATTPTCEPLALRQRIPLWPEIERDVLLAYSDVALDSPVATPRNLGSPLADPIFAYNARANGEKAAKDLQALFILQVYAHHAATGDAKFLDAVWPACKKTFTALHAATSAENPIPVHTKDDTALSPCPLQGVSLLVGGLWVAAVDAMERLAIARKDPLAADIAGLRARAAARLDQALWRPAVKAYAIDSTPASAAAMPAGGLEGVRYAQTLGLHPVLPQAKLHQHLAEVFKRCVAPLRDSTGDGVGDVGAVNALTVEGKPIGVGLCHEVSLATTYRLAAVMAHVARATDDKDMAANALKTAYGAYYQTWFVSPDKALWAFNIPQAWHAENPARTRAAQTIAARAIWDLLLELKAPFSPPPRRD
ncbi:hypothetical protein HQ560_00565 [bacterium]|nr:hypothetical protein [bacterium]